MSEFADRLRQALKYLNLTQQKAADATGISLRSIKNYVHGNTTPDADALARICEGLDIAPNWILFGRGPMQQNVGNADGGAVRQDGRAGIKPLSQPRRDWLQAAEWLLQQLQKADRSDEILDLMKTRGVSADLAEEFARGKRKLEESEREVLAAFCTDWPIAAEPPPSGAVEIRPKGQRRRKSRVPQAALRQRTESQPGLMTESGGLLRVAPTAEEALKRYEKSWEDEVRRWKADRFSSSQ